jgi:hypothetical protein
MNERLGWMPSAHLLAELAQEVPPMVTAMQIAESAAGTPAALLCWGRAEEGWYGGIAWIYRSFRGSPLRALLTVWLPAAQIVKRAGENYSRVPRVRLDGPPGRWPQLPAAYPKVGADWLARHHHAAVPDPTGEYRDLREEIRRSD